MVHAKREFISLAKQKFYDEIRQYQLTLRPTKEIEGYGSLPIVGEKNYPFLKTHNISNEGEDSSFFQTGEIVKKPYEEVFKIKAKNILGSTEESTVRKVNSRVTEEIRSIYKSKHAIEFSSEFEKELKFDRIVMNKAAGVVGSKNPLLHLEANENTTTSKQIEKYTVEDVKARDAMIKLYERGINEHQIISLLALGSFGIQSNRKLVPTHWAISAYDQTIEKHIHKKLITYPPISDFELYFHKDKENAFLILLYPEEFQGEVIETFATNVERDYVAFDNVLHKKEPETAGGFYATKLAIFEDLVKRKKQASFVSVRIIGDYEIPLGVVFVRECVRTALKKTLFKSSNEKEIWEYVKKNFPKHFLFHSQSKVLEERKKQRKLRDFF